MRFRRMRSSRQPALYACLFWAALTHAQTTAGYSQNYQASSTRVTDVLLRSPEQKLQLELKHRAQVRKRLGQLLQRGYTPHDVHMGWYEDQCAFHFCSPCD